MAYATTNPPKATNDAFGASGKKWLYSSTDSFATVFAADYFSNGDDLGMNLGDQIVVLDTTDNALVAHGRVTSVTADGAATATDNRVHELTASGAVTSGVGCIELNHASTIIAATIATTLDHANQFLMVKDTSASGTAAHTATITTGTWDGSNKILTFNAPNEALLVYIDSAGNGTIIENVGSVAIS